MTATSWLARLGLLLFLMLPGSIAAACETVEYNPTPLQLRENAIAFFDQESVVYEGILLGKHSFERGGKFLVLKTYKGTASTFDVINLPGGSSCYGGVPVFSIGILSNHENDLSSFDGFVTDDYVDVWKDKGFIDSGLRSPSLHLKLFFLIILATIAVGGFFTRKRLKKKNRAV